MTGPSPTVKARLKASLYARFEAEREARQLSESELVRLAMIALLDAAEEEAPRSRAPVTQVRQSVETTCAAVKLAPKTVWMPALLATAALARAEAKGMSFSRWISCLVQANLMHSPVLSDVELRAIDASRRELAAIGRNISQVARTLGESYFETERVRLDKLAELSLQVTKTRDAITALVHASRHSWGIG